MTIIVHYEVENTPHSWLMTCGDDMTYLLGEYEEGKEQKENEITAFRDIKNALRMIQRDEYGKKKTHPTLKSIEKATPEREAEWEKNYREWKANGKKGVIK